MSDVRERRVRVVNGRERYADPWHPFAETGAALRDRLAGAYQVESRSDEPDALGDLAGIDLLVINCGAGADPANPPGPSAEWSAAFAGCERWLNGGGRLLGVHTAAATFADWPAWPALLGGRWVRGTSMHPPRGPSRFRPVTADHPTLAGLPEVEADDERYSLLSRDSGTVPLLEHDLDGSAEVMAWATADGRAVYSGLGHDGRAYASPTAERFLANTVGWLLSPPASPG